MKFACADFSFPLLSHDQALDLIASLGFQGVDFGLFSGRSHIRPEEIMADIPGKAREFTKKFRDRGLDFADVYLQPADNFKSLAPNNPDQQARLKGRDIFQRILEFTVRCNALHMSDLPGVQWEEDKNGDSLKRSAEELAWRVDKARQVGVTYSVEAHIGSVAPKPEEALRLVEMAPGLTLTLDYCHFTYQGIPDDKIEPLVRHASHFHARGACKGRLQSPIKENTIDYPRVLQAMKRDNYTGYIGVEYVWVDWERCNEVDNLSETIMLRNLLENAKV